MDGGRAPRVSRGTRCGRLQYHADDTRSTDAAASSCIHNTPSLSISLSVLLICPVHHTATRHSTPLFIFQDTSLPQQTDGLLLIHGPSGTVHAQKWGFGSRHTTDRPSILAHQTSYDRRLASHHKHHQITPRGVRPWDTLCKFYVSPAYISIHLFQDSPRKRRKEKRRKRHVCAGGWHFHLSVALSLLRASRPVALRPVTDSLYQYLRLIRTATSINPASRSASAGAAT